MGILNELFIKQASFFEGATMLDTSIFVKMGRPNFAMIELMPRIPGINDNEYTGFVVTIMNRERGQIATKIFHFERFLTINGKAIKRICEEKEYYTVWFDGGICTANRTDETISVVDIDSYRVVAQAIMTYLCMFL